ncbi:MAG TPA: STY0301 family protein [Burkholderiaceae bacterium]
MRHAGTRLPIVLALASTTALATHAASTAKAPPAVAGKPASAPAPSATASVAAPSKPLVDACPAQLPVRQTVSEAVAGWTPLNQQGSYPFVRVAFYPGPPAESALIVPTIEYRGQAGLHDRWELPHRGDGYWMTCAYANTTATVARKLADDVDFCLADYDGRFMTLVVKHWSCGVKRTMPPPSWERPLRSVKPATKAAGRRGE